MTFINVICYFEKTNLWRLSDKESYEKSSLSFSGEHLIVDRIIEFVL